jgi:hypothetical protein
MATTTRQIVWVDAGGRTRVTLPTGNATLATIMAKLQLHSNADVLSWFEGPPTFLSPAPVAAVYADVVDLARLTFTDGTDLVNLALPAPQSAIFLADGVTVDPSTIVDLTTAAIGTLLTAAGVPVTTFVGGLRNLRASGS